MESHADRIRATRASRKAVQGADRPRARRRRQLKDGARVLCATIARGSIERAGAVEYQRARREHALAGATKTIDHVFSPQSARFARRRQAEYHAFVQGSSMRSGAIEDAI